MVRKLRKFFLIPFFLCLWVCSCTPQDQDATLSIPDFRASEAVSVQARDFAPGQLEAHYQKHGYQFGAWTQEQYLEGARQLLNATPSSDVLEKTRPNGDILHYRLSTGEFAVMTGEGRIRTYFKTDERYWMRQ